VRREDANTEDPLPEARPWGEDPLARQIEAAGRRPRAPEAAVDRAKAATHAVWSEQLRRKRSRWPSRLAIAAALLLAVSGLIYSLFRQPEVSPTIALLQRVIGEVIVDGDFRPEGDLLADSSLRKGAVIATGPGGLAAFQLDPGLSVRLDSSTEVNLIGPRQLRLERGALYVDSTRGGGLEVITALGVVRDIGTQFEVRLLPSSTGQLRVSVREGQVVVKRGVEAIEARGGEQLTLSAGVPDRRLVSRQGDSWTWAESTAVAPEIEGRPLNDVLVWVGRETGYTWRIVDPTLERDRMTILLHGSIAGLAPLDALRLVLDSSGLSYRKEGDIFWLERPKTKASGD
jgi:FecR protein